MRASEERAAMGHGMMDFAARVRRESSRGCHDGDASSPPCNDFHPPAYTRGPGARPLGPLTSPKSLSRIRLTETRNPNYVVQLV